MTVADVTDDDCGITTLLFLGERLLLETRAPRGVASTVVTVAGKYQVTAHLIHDFANTRTASRHSTLLMVLPVSYTDSDGTIGLPLDSEPLARAKCIRELAAGGAVSRCSFMTSSTVVHGRPGRTFNFSASPPDSAAKIAQYADYFFGLSKLNRFGFELLVANSPNFRAVHPFQAAAAPAPLRCPVLFHGPRVFPRRAARSVAAQSADRRRGSVHAPRLLSTAFPPLQPARARQRSYSPHGTVDCTPRRAQTPPRIVVLGTYHADPWAAHLPLVASAWAALGYTIVLVVAGDVQPHLYFGSGMSVLEQARPPGDCHVCAGTGLDRCHVCTATC